MAGDSNGRVTITLGRTGQVVKRAAAVLDVEYGDDSMQGSGSKRSVRDRLGANFDIKRQRGESYLTSLNSSGVEDARIGKDDLRLKLMQKNASRRAPNNYKHNIMDLRGKLSRTVQPPSRTVQCPGPSLGTLDSRQHLPGPKDPSILSRMPSTRSVNDSPLMDSSRNSYSPWTLDHIRSRSPDGIIGSSRGLSSSRHMEEIQRRPLSRTFDDARAIPYANKDVFDAHRPVSSSTAFMAKPVLPSVSSKPATPVLSHLPPTSAILQKSSYVGEEQTIEGLLHSLGLGKYAILFKAEEVDMTALKQMGEGDLKELGIPMGPRKKILLALLPRTKRQP